MEAKELRIGNWVEMYKEDSTPFKISASNIVVEYKTNKQGYTRYKPIPLTEEWLLKFGFVENRFDDCYEIWKGNLCYSVNENNLFCFGQGTEWSYEIEIKHVHQLQNLFFALTGMELKIKDND